MKDTVKLTVLMCAIFVTAVTASYGQSSRTPSQTITSGKVNTLGKFSFQYGRLDISVKIPRTANGLWPAILLLGADYNKVPWPDCGEIDLLEMGHFSGIEKGTQEKLFSAAVHWGPVLADQSNPSYRVFKINTYGLQYGAFHLITMIWTPKKISMYLDLDKLPEEQRDRAVPYFEMEITEKKKKYFCRPFSIVINLAAGGNFTGITGNENNEKISALNQGNSFQAAMYIEFVRVWDQEGKLIFIDEFSGSRLDTAKWNVEVTDGGGGNQELQIYRHPNVTVGKERASGKNCLILTVKRE
jgi:beta-glucanase (GH16 family)